MFSLRRVLMSSACLQVPFASWKTNRRVVYMIGSAVPMMVGYIMFVASTNLNVKYGELLSGSSCFEATEHPADTFIDSCCLHRRNRSFLVRTSL